MRLTSVCISEKREEFSLSVPFYCHVEGYKPIQGHDNLDRERLEYLTERYNRAIEKALHLHAETDHLLVIDSYYLRYTSEVAKLIDDYTPGTILGASIWFWYRHQILPVIRYYDTLSVREFRDWKWRWHSEKDLPTGIVRVSGVGGCWILPRRTWEQTGGFFIPEDEPQAGGSRCLVTSNLKILLDCNVRLWRAKDTNPDIQAYSWSKRVHVSLGVQKNRIVEKVFRRNVQFCRDQGNR
jgi:hypothetical protein